MDGTSSKTVQHFHAIHAQHSCLPCEWQRFRSVPNLETKTRDDFLISLDTLADVLNIERPKQAMSGEEVPAAYERGEIAPILIYCCIDTETTAQAAQLMLGIAANLN